LTFVDVFFAQKNKSLSRIFSANLKQKIIMVKGVQRAAFRNQTGSGQDDYYQAGIMMAQAVFEEGGVNALLAFLAGYNSAG
jgi:hypothetical protein|tara:strand:+ start:366 stop:608 length:243 start_codon:yes stop_codon:yes gene_type:complete